jgi:hypothetical protein
MLTIRIGRGSLIVVSLVALVAITVAFGLIFSNHRQAAHKARVATAEARYTKLKAASDKLAQLDEPEREAWYTYNRDLNSGSESSEERHDYLTNGNSTDQHVFSLITNETDMANKAEVDEGELHDGMLQIVEVYEGIYGESATRSVRADEMRRDQLTLQSLSYWQRVSEDIKDSVRATLDGRYGSGESGDEIDNLYEQSSQYETQAKTLAAEEHHEFGLLTSRLKSDTARAKSALTDLAPKVATTAPPPDPTYPGSPTPGPVESRNRDMNSRVVDLLMRAKAAHLTVSRPLFDETVAGTQGEHGPLPAMDQVEMNFTGSKDIQFDATALKNQGIGEERWIFGTPRMSSAYLRHRAEWLLNIFYPVDVQRDFRNAKPDSEDGGYTEYRGHRFVYFTDVTYSSFGVMTPAGYKLFAYMSD